MSFERISYEFQEDSGTGEVCLIKDLATADSVTVQVTTTDGTATGKPHPAVIISCPFVLFPLYYF